MVEVVRNGVRLHCIDRGSGPPVLFHTGGGGDHAMWEAAGYPAELSDCRHLLFDHRGHGDSDKPTDLDAHRVTEYVADVIAVLDAVGVKQVAIVGYSDGAYLAYALAAAYPERVVAVVGLGAASSSRPARSEQLAKAVEVRRVGLVNWLQVAADAEPEPPPAWLTENLATTPTEMLALKIEAWADAPAAAAYFPRIKAPTLIVYGEAEDPSGDTETAAALLGHGTTVAVPRCGHLGVFWRVEQTGPVVSEFIHQAFNAESKSEE